MGNTGEFERLVDYNEVVYQVIKVDVMSIVP